MLIFEFLQGSGLLGKRKCGFRIPYPFSKSSRTISKVPGLKVVDYTSYRHQNIFVGNITVNVSGIFKIDVYVALWAWCSAHLYTSCHSITLNYFPSWNNGPESRIAQTFRHLPIFLVLSYSGSLGSESVKLRNPGKIGIYPRTLKMWPLKVSAVWF